MPLDDSTRVLTALSVLRDTPDELLLTHKAELEAVVRKLAKHTATGPVETLIAKLENNLEDVKRRLSTEYVKEFGPKPKWMDDDPRIVDIQVTGESRKSLEVMLRRVLGQRSLAMEFYDWKSNHLTPKIQKKESVSIFLSINASRFRDVEVARRGIRLGKKLLKFEKVLGIGFSALLIFCHRAFENVHDKQLTDLKNAIDKQDLDAIRDKQESIKQLSEEKKEWLHGKQTAYNGKWP